MNNEVDVRVSATVGPDQDRPRPAFVVTTASEGKVEPAIFVFPIQLLDRGTYAFSL